MQTRTEHQTVSRRTNRCSPSNNTSRRAKNDRFLSNSHIMINLWYNASYRESRSPDEIHSWSPLSSSPFPILPGPPAKRSPHTAPDRAFSPVLPQSMSRARPRTTSTGGHPDTLVPGPNQARSPVRHTRPGPLPMLEPNKRPRPITVLGSFINDHLLQH